MFWYVENHHLWLLNLYFSSTVLVIAISVAQVVGTKMQALIAALPLFRKCNLAYWHSFQASTTSKPWGITCTVFFLQLLHTPWYHPVPFLVSLFSHFCYSVSDQQHNSVTMKITGILNWYIKPNKKNMNNIEFLPYDPRVTLFTTSHAIPIYVFFLCTNNIQAPPM